MQPKYCFYATILDAYWGYLNSDVVWDNYWGWSENPPHTPDEFHEMKFNELIDRINRVPFDNEKADRGTCFNEVIDCMVENRKSETVKVDRVYKEVNNYDICNEFCNQKNCDYDCDNCGEKYNQARERAFKSKAIEVVALKATYNNREFTFPISICREFANYFKGALTQQRVEAILPTRYGDVLVYGFIDELMPTSVHDIKTTGSYSVGKFKNNFQHLVYPYALIQNGNDIRTFEYNILEFSKAGYPVDTYTETYVFNPERDIPILTNHCEDFIRFLEENKGLITDTKIINLQSNE